MKKPNVYTLYLCHAAVQSDTEAAAKKAKANEEWYEHNKEWKKEYNQEYYQQNKDYWEQRYKEQKASADSAEENMKRAQQEYTDYNRKQSGGTDNTKRITKLSDTSSKNSVSSAAKLATNPKSLTSSKNLGDKTAATTSAEKKDYDLSSISKEEMELANKVIRGDFNVGKKRKELLNKYIAEKKLDIDPVKIQRYVNRLAKVGYDWKKSGIKTPSSDSSSNKSKSTNKTVKAIVSANTAKSSNRTIKI